MNKVAMGGLSVRKSFYLGANLYTKQITSQLHDVLARSLAFLLLFTGLEQGPVAKFGHFPRKEAPEKRDLSVRQNSKKRQFSVITAQFSGLLQLATACISSVHWLHGGFRGGGRLPIFQAKSAAKNGKASRKTLSWHGWGARFWRKAMKNDHFSREDLALWAQIVPSS
jgi:hypothetical protein